MNKEIFILNNSIDMYSKDNINKLVLEINKLKINKDMKKMLLVASLNLISSVKTTKALEYQLHSFKNQEKILPEKTKSKYVNKIIKELNELPLPDFNSTISELTDYLNANNINIKGQ